MNPHLRRRAIALFLVSLTMTTLGSGCDRCNKAPRRNPAFVPPPDAGISAGCGLERSSPAGEESKVDGRSVWTYGPKSYDATHAYPLVLTLHGYGGNGRDFEKWFEMEKYTNGAAFVVYPNAGHPTTGFGQGGGGVWDFRGEEDVTFLANVLEAVSRDYCIDRTRVLVFGFSFGSKMSQHFGCRRPDLVKAAAAGAGSWAQKTPECGRPIPVMVVHRTKDDNELVSWAKEASERWAKVDRCSSDTEPSELGHNCIKHKDCAPGSSVTFCEDTWFDPSWQKSWNHTVRPEYLALVWTWFEALP